jgi:hypothetical protein
VWTFDVGSVKNPIAMVTRRADPVRLWITTKNWTLHATPSGASTLLHRRRSVPATPIPKATISHSAVASARTNIPKPYAAVSALEGCLLTASGTNQKMHVSDTRGKTARANEALPR